METTSRDAFADVLPVAGRVLIAPLFIGAGLAKFGDIAGTAGYMQAHGMPLAELLVWPAALLELAGHGLAQERDQAGVCALALQQVNCGAVDVIVAVGGGFFLQAAGQEGELGLVDLAQLGAGLVVQEHDHGKTPFAVTGVLL